jgi:hypothetical protein
VHHDEWKVGARPKRASIMSVVDDLYQVRSVIV